MVKNIFFPIFAWGFALWLIGYILGIIFFMFIPQNFIGWAILPIGVIITYWVLAKKMKLYPLKEYLLISVVWTFLAIVLDYIFIIMLLKPTHGYYKLDVYIYYILLFLLPIAIGFYRTVMDFYK